MMCPAGYSAPFFFFFKSQNTKERVCSTGDDDDDRFLVWLRIQEVKPF